MTGRTENGTTYTQQWTVENRLDTVTGNGHSVQYRYDGDGNRVKKVQDGQTTIYPSASLRAGSGALFEKNVSTQRMVHARRFAHPLQHPSKTFIRFKARSRPPLTAWWPAAPRA